MNLLSLTLLATGGIMVYSAVKGKNPVDVVKSALTSAGTAPTVYTLPDSTPTPTPAPSSGGTTGTSNKNQNTVVGV